MSAFKQALNRDTQDSKTVDKNSKMKKKITRDIGFREAVYVVNLDSAFIVFTAE